MFIPCALYASLFVKDQDRLSRKLVPFSTQRKHLNDPPAFAQPPLLSREREEGGGGGRETRFRAKRHYAGSKTSFHPVWKLLENLRKRRKERVNASPPLRLFAASVLPRPLRGLSERQTPKNRADPRRRSERESRKGGERGEPHLRHNGLF